MKTVAWSYFWKIELTSQRPLVFTLIPRGTSCSALPPPFFFIALILSSLIIFPSQKSIWVNPGAHRRASSAALKAKEAVWESHRINCFCSKNEETTPQVLDSLTFRHAACTTCSMRGLHRTLVPMLAVTELWENMCNETLKTFLWMSAEMRTSVRITVDLVLKYIYLCVYLFKVKHFFPFNSNMKKPFLHLYLCRPEKSINWLVTGAKIN